MTLKYHILLEGVSKRLADEILTHATAHGIQYRISTDRSPDTGRAPIRHTRLSVTVLSALGGRSAEAGNSWFTYTELQEAITASRFSPDSIGPTLSRLCRDGVVERGERGMYRLTYM